MMTILNKTNTIEATENVNAQDTTKTKIKTFSDYEGEEALDLWIDLLDPITNIMGDKEILDMRKKPGTKVGHVVKALLKAHKKDVTDILIRIDPTPLNGLNIVTRLIGLIGDLSNSDAAKSFFSAAEAPTQEKPDGSSGSATENIEDAET